MGLYGEVSRQLEMQLFAVEGIRAHVGHAEAVEY